MPKSIHFLGALVVALGVASLVGLDNLLRLPVVAHDEAGGVTLLALGPELRLAAPLCHAAPGSEVDVGFYADDVMLCLERPVGLSARNALPCEVCRIDVLGPEVLAELRAGEATLVARLTPGAASELHLTDGSRAVALIKTAAIHLLGIAREP